VKNQELNFEGVEQEPLKTFAERAYLDYSMYVILDRALPHIGRAQPIGRRKAQKIRTHGWRCHRQVSSARRFGLL
jgi:topoisomerase IV subunit A